jgi:hypothetical protein
MNPSTAATAKGLLIGEADRALAEFDELTRTRTKSGLSRLGKERIRKSGRAIRATIIPGYVQLRASEAKLTTSPMLLLLRIVLIELFVS